MNDVLAIYSGGAARSTVRHGARAARGMDRSVARLASGQRITTAADDAAGVAISENLRSKQRSTAQALRNGNDGIALLQTALSSHHQISDRLIRMRELAVQASSDTLTINDRKGITKEFNLSTNDIDRIALVSEFNGVELMTGTAVLKAINSSVLGIDAAKLTNAKFSRLAIIAIDKALGKMGIREANIGADINQIAAAVDQLGNQDVLLQQAHSQIRDADVGREAAEMRRHQVQLQATTAMQAQANAAGSMVLRLLE